jgi:crooked neck
MLLSIFNKLTSQFTHPTPSLRNNVSSSSRCVDFEVKANRADGDRAGVELTVLGKRRIQYEEELAYDGTNYDAWFSLARLEEDAYRADKEDGEDVEPTRVREVYERAVANIPPATEKR